MHPWGRRSSRGQPGVKLLRNALWQPNLVGTTLGQSVVHWWGQRSCRGHYIYINKKKQFCQSVCLCVYPAMRNAVRGCIKLKLGKVVGNGPPRFVVNFSKWPYQRSKVIQRSNCIRNVIRPPNLVERTHGRSVMHSWGQRSCRGQLGSTLTRGEITKECSIATNFDRKNPRLHCSVLLGSKVIEGSTGSARGQIAQECPIPPKFGRKNPWMKFSALMES